MVFVPNVRRVSLFKVGQSEAREFDALTQGQAI